MAKFMRRQVVVDAVRFIKGYGAIPGVCYDKCMGINWPHVHNSHGIINIKDGDWIVTGIGGQIYPCSGDVFNDLYQPIHELDDDPLDDQTILSGG